MNDIQNTNYVFTDFITKFHLDLRALIYNFNRCCYKTQFSALDASSVAIIYFATRILFYE